MSWACKILSTFGLMSWSANEASYWFHEALKVRHRYMFVDADGVEWWGP